MNEQREEESKKKKLYFSKKFSLPIPQVSKSSLSFVSHILNWVFVTCNWLIHHAFEDVTKIIPLHGITYLQNQEYTSNENFSNSII